MRKVNYKLGRTVRWAVFFAHEITQSRGHKNRAHPTKASTYCYIYLFFNRLALNLMAVVHVGLRQRLTQPTKLLETNIKAIIC